MAFSGSTDFTYTRDQIIKAALRKCRAYDAEHGAPEAYQTRDAAEALNLLVKEFQTEGAILWARSTVEVTLAKGKRSYTVGPSGYVDQARPLRIFNPVRREISTKEDIPLNIYGRMDYDNLTNKFETGVPVNIYYDRKITQGEVYVWPVPDTSKYKLVMTVEAPLEDFDASGNDAYMPSYAYSYFVWALAASLAPEYGLPLDEKMAFQAEAKGFKERLLDFEEESDGFQMVPDMTCYGGFR